MKVNLFYLRVALALTAVLTIRCWGLEDTTPVEKAILEASQDRGIRLSDKARKTIGIATSPILSKGPHSVTQTSMVYYQDKVGIYRLREGWFKLIELSDIERTSSGFVLRTFELQSGDEIVVRGTALLRVAEMEAFSGGG